MIVEFVSGDSAQVSVPRDPVTADFIQQLALKCGGRKPRIFKDGDELESDQHLNNLLSGTILSGVQLLCDDPAGECLNWA